VCDCGWSFVEETMTAPRQLSKEPADEGDHGSPGNRQIAIGAAFLVIGIFVTAGTYGAAASSPSGGMYIVAYGPILFGLISIVRGLTRKRH